PRSKNSDQDWPLRVFSPRYPATNAVVMTGRAVNGAHGHVCADNAELQGQGRVRNGAYGICIGRAVEQPGPGATAKRIATLRSDRARIKDHSSAHGCSAVRVDGDRIATP